MLDLLSAYVDEHPPGRYSKEIEGHFWIKRIEPGKFWLGPFTSSESEVGSVLVPSKASRMCKTGWDISATVVKTPKGWRLKEVWNVSP